MNTLRSLYLWPDNASTISHSVDALVWFLILTCGFFFAAIFLAITYFSLRYRRRSELEIPPEIEGSVWLEIAWSVIPLGLLMVMFGWGAVLYVHMKRPPPSALVINVIAKQWMWKTQHDTGQREINALHVPTGVPVQLILTSQDVIHDFSIPAFRIKQDVLPGSFVSEWFQADRPGQYHLFCSEYCGTDHSRMVGTITVLTPENYQSWLAGTQPLESPVISGQKLFTTYGCAQCHGQVAPTLAGLYNSRVTLADGSTIVADDAYLRESILNPPARLVAGYGPLMPSYRGQLSDDQLADLVAYIKHLAQAVTTRPAQARPHPDQFPHTPPAVQGVPQ